MTTPLSSSLALALAAGGYTAATIGRAVMPGNSAQNAVYRAGMRMLKGEHTTDIDRLGDLARGLGVRITVEPTGGVFLEKVAASPVATCHT